MNFSTQDISTEQQSAMNAFKDENSYVSDIIGQVLGFEAGFNAAIEYIRKEGAITVGEEYLWPPVHPAANPDYIKEFENVIASYTWDGPEQACTWDGPEQAMLDMYTKDRIDMKEVLSHYKKGEWEQAKEKARHMDTAARECIPQGLWEEIQ